MSKSYQSDCPWLLKANSLEYDLLDVSSDSWSIWVGTINNADVSISCNSCSNIVDCNLNGECLGGKCECDTSDVSQKVLRHEIFSRTYSLIPH